MRSREELLEDVKTATMALTIANRALAAFDEAPEQNVFESLDKAKFVLLDTLRDRAYEDCEGAGNCGNEFYLQKFLVDGELYEARLDVEYNRHDKTYYYIESVKYSFRKVESDEAPCSK